MFCLIFESFHFSLVCHVNPLRHDLEQRFSKWNVLTSLLLSQGPYFEEQGYSGFADTRDITKNEEGIWEHSTYLSLSLLPLFLSSHTFTILKYMFVLFFYSFQNNAHVYYVMHWSKG